MASIRFHSVREVTNQLQSAAAQDMKFMSARHEAAVPASPPDVRYWGQTRRDAGVPRVRSMTQRRSMQPKCYRRDGTGQTCGIPFNGNRAVVPERCAWYYEPPVSRRVLKFFHTTREGFMKKLLVLVALIGLAGSALAQDAMKATRVKPDQLTWKANPALPPGAQFAILMGDPTKSEVVVQRVKF